MVPPDFSEFNFTISIESVADTVKKVRQRTHEERAQRFDDIAAKQGNVMGAAIQLAGLGVPMNLVEHALYVLLVLFECFESESPDLPSVSQETVQAEFDRHAASLSFTKMKLRPMRPICKKSNGRISANKPLPHSSYLI